MWNLVIILCCLTRTVLGTSPIVPQLHTNIAKKVSSIKCPCSATQSQVSACAPYSKSNANQPTTPEVIVITDGQAKFHHWKYDSISTVIARENTERNAYPELMCYVKSKGKKYGIMETSWDYSAIEKAQLSSRNVTENSTAHQFGHFMEWMYKIRNHTESLFADVVVLNLLPVLSGSDLDKRNCTILHTYLQHLRNTVKTSSATYTYLVQFYCVVPDRPVYFSDNCDVTEKLIDLCEKFMINPDSFQADSNMKCRARATIPLTRLVGAVDEYVSHGVELGRIILGVAWHGYKYKCDSYEETSEICLLPKMANTSECDYTAKKIPLSDLVHEWKDENPRNFNWSKFYQAPYMTTKNVGNDSSTWYEQLWYENMHSLSLKYRLVKEMRLAGVSVWVADELPYVRETFFKNYDNSMWSWLLHSVFRQTSPLSHHSSNLAGSMAAVGVACLVIGAILGFSFACVISYKKNKRRMKNKEPFETDDDFQDGDDLNL